MKRAKLLWMDLEMTGLDAEKDKILEVAAIATDWDFAEIATFEAVVRVDAEIIEKRMVGDFWDKFPEVKAALVEQNDDGVQSQTAEKQLMEFIEANFDNTKPVLLAGNSIHQDRKFIDREWPKFAAQLHYRMLDVSAWKVVFEGKYRKKFAKPENHRALDDIRGSIEELQYYLKKVRT